MSIKFEEGFSVFICFNFLELHHILDPKALQKKMLYFIYNYWILVKIVFEKIIIPAVEWFDLQKMDGCNFSLELTAPGFLVDCEMLRRGQCNADFNYLFFRKSSFRLRQTERVGDIPWNRMDIRPSNSIFTENGNN